MSNVTAHDAPILRLAVIGAGILGQRHARFWAQQQGIELVAVVDPDRGRAKSLLETLGEFGAHDVRDFADATTMMATVRPDAVSVATPDFAHHAPVLTALESGAHVLVEKPLAMTTGDAIEMVDAARVANRHLMVNHSMRWMPRHRTVRASIGQDLGPLVFAQSSKMDTVYVPTKMLSWASRTSPAWFLTAHDLDLIRWFAEDRVVRVQAQGVRRILVGQGIDTWDVIQAHVTFSRGAIANFEASWIHPETYAAVIDDYMHLVAERGVVYLDRGRETLEIFDHERVRHPKHATVYENDGRIYGAFRHSLEHFIECIRTGSEPETSGRDVLGVISTLEALHVSLENRAPIDVADHGSRARVGL